MDDEVEIGGEAGEYLLNMFGCGGEVALDLQNIFGDGGEYLLQSEGRKKSIDHHTVLLQQILLVKLVE